MFSSRSSSIQKNVNTIAPAAVRTRIYTNEFLEEIAKITPLGRVASPEEVANLAVFLASDDAKYLTGRAMVIDECQ